MTQTVTMKPKITIIEPIEPRTISEAEETVKKKRVAAYARVSTEQEEQQSSYEAQLKYYTAYISGNPDWTLVRVYPEIVSNTGMGSTR